MNMMSRYPLRYLVIGILAAFSLLIGLLTYMATQPLVIQNVEGQAADRLRAELTQLQGVLQILLRAENVEGAKSVVVSLGSAPEHELALLTDATSAIIASTRLADVGVAWTTLTPPLDRLMIDQVNISGGAVVRLTSDSQYLAGYVNICDPAVTGTLRPPQCGFLYQRINLSQAREVAVDVLHRQAVAYGLGLAVLAGVLGIIFHRVVTRRVERLIATVNRFTAGDTAARAGLEGQDELARVGEAFDSMAQTIANNQQELQGLNTQLERRVEERTRALQESEQRFRVIFEQAAVGVAQMASRSGEFVRINQRYCDILGYSQDEMLGRTFQEVTQSTALPEDVYNMNRLLNGEIENFSMERHYARKDGSTIWVNLFVSPMWQAGEEPSYHISVMEDITERKIIEMEILQQRAELARSNADLQQFASVAAHDLQEPLRMVSSYTKLLGRRYQGKLDADADEFIAYAVDGANRMQTLIRDLLEYSRVGKGKLHMTMIDTEDVVVQASRNLQSLITERQAKIHWEHLPHVRADVSRLTQVFQNLFANAMKFCAASTIPCITIRAEPRSMDWLFSVQDNGIGMKSEHTTKIFEVFQRLHNRSQYSGTGIGLALCKRIVEDHGGQIWVESVPKKGSTFFFTIVKES
ncbi:MAG: hypothetical protein NPIRA02_05060 [Nitrospirales bacterium]|nr:MAG: hypothetical protein NPIRA02_05060 [Nitrospirales bacterium]